MTATDLPAINFIDVPLDPEIHARLVAAEIVALAVRCLQCGWIGEGHRLFQPNWQEAKKHYRAEHPGAWENPDRPKGTYLWETVGLNANGEVAS